MNFIKKNLATLIIACAALLAFVFALFLPGASYKQTQGGVEVSSTAALIGIMFGSSKIVSTASGVTMEALIKGGMSIFGLISVILLALGIAAVIASIFVKEKKLDLIGSILIVLAGIFVFLTLVAGTNVTAMTMAGETITDLSEPFAEVFGEMKLGAGAYVYGILALLGGGFGILNNFKKIV